MAPYPNADRVLACGDIPAGNAWHQIGSDGTWGHKAWEEVEWSASSVWKMSDDWTTQDWIPSMSDTHKEDFDLTRSEWDRCSAGGAPNIDIAPDADSGCVNQSKSRWRDNEASDAAWNTASHETEDASGETGWTDSMNVDSDPGHHNAPDTGADSTSNEEDQTYWPGQLVAYHDLILDPPGTGRGNPRLLLLFFHSCAHGPEDVLQYIPYLWEAGLSPQEVRIVAPCSPQRGVSHACSANSWYDYVTDRCWKGKEDRISYAQFVEQRQRLISILEEEHRRLPPDGRIVIGGLSQGASLALDVMLHAPPHIDTIAGCFCSRGMMQQETLRNLWQGQVRQRAPNCPVFIFHGRSDNTVPWRLAQQSYNYLVNSDFEVSLYAESSVCHSTESLQEYRRVAKFVARAFTSDR